MPPRHIAVLGGGLTGLSSAFHLSRRYPTSIITLLEKQPRLGGWVRSERVSIGNEVSPRTVLLEAGPRTLRPNANSVLELINLLDLQTSLVTTLKTAPAAKARFLHVPGSAGIVQVPSTILTVLSSPLRSILLAGVIGEPFRRSNRPKGSTDESLDSFITRRFGEPFARVFGSALVHGVYASDSRNLSVRAAFPSLWEAEERGWGSVVRGFLRPRKAQSSAQRDDYELGNIHQMMKDVSVYSFIDGIGALTRALERNISLNSNIRILRNTSVTSLQLKGDTIRLDLESGDSLNSTHAISTLPLPILDTIIPKHSLPHLNANPMSSVFVLNLVFPAPPSVIHPPGFGYLIPRPQSGYSLDAPSILGTVFDSSSLHAQDTSPSTTKMTVMMGGPYPEPSLEQLSLPSIKRQLEDHLQRQLPDPIYFRIWRNEKCIPTLMPGHLERMNEMRDVLKEKWDSRLEVVGAGVNGVSVGDCVESGKRVGERWGDSDD